MNMIEFWVDRTDFRNIRTIEASRLELEEGEIRDGIDNFALLAFMRENT